MRAAVADLADTKISDGAWILSLTYRMLIDFNKVVPEVSSRRSLPPDHRPPWHAGGLFLLARLPRKVSPTA
jgi:hypothetical protein